MKKVIRRLAFAALRWSGIAAVCHHVFLARKLTILCYHDPRPELFDIHLRELKRRFNVISLRDYVGIRSSGDERALPRHALVITLDDGHRGNMGLRTAMLKNKVPATIFLTSAIVGTNRHFWWKAVPDRQERERLKYMPDEERLRELARTGFAQDHDYPERHALSNGEVRSLSTVFDLQSHTRFHPVLTMCSESRAEDEIAGARKELSRKYGLDVYALAYPNGDHGEREVKLARSAGYACAVITEEGFNDRHTDLWRLKRISVPDDSSVDELLVRAAGVWSALKKWVPARTKRRGAVTGIPASKAIPRS